MHRGSLESASWPRQAASTDPLCMPESNATHSGLKLAVPASLSWRSQTVPSKPCHLPPPRHAPAHLHLEDWHFSPFDSEGCGAMTAQVYLLPQLLHCNCIQCLLRMLSSMYNLALHLGTVRLLDILQAVVGLDTCQQSTSSVVI